MSNFVSAAPRHVLRRLAALVAMLLVATLVVGSGTPTTAYAATATSSDRVHKRNLLRAHSFTDHGYARVTTSDNWEGDGDFELGSCDPVKTYQAPGAVNRTFRLYQGAVTTGEQVVVQFRNRDSARAYVNNYRAAIGGCRKRTHGLVTFSSAHRPHTAGATESFWWSTRTDQGWTPSWGTVSLVRVGDRVSVLTMYSVSSKPSKTMNVPALMRDMVDRLDID